jgi:hypothetical protein
MEQISWSGLPSVLSPKIILLITEQSWLEDGQSSMIATAVNHGTTARLRSARERRLHCSVWMKRFLECGRVRRGELHNMGVKNDHPAERNRGMIRG